MTLFEDIGQALKEMSLSDEVVLNYNKRIAEGDLTRDENINSHVCAYFFPVNKKEKLVLIGDHKKSGLWLAPGGHVDKGELLIETVNREMEEELGVNLHLEKNVRPSLLTITEIKQDTRPCQRHFDVWFFIETDGKDFNIDYTEYHEVRWVSTGDARRIVTETQNLKAIDFIEQNLF